MIFLIIPRIIPSVFPCLLNPLLITPPQKFVSKLLIYNSLKFCLHFVRGLFAFFEPFSLHRLVGKGIFDTSI